MTIPRSGSFTRGSRFPSSRPVFISLGLAGQEELPWEPEGHTAPDPLYARFVPERHSTIKSFWDNVLGLDTPPTALLEHVSIGRVVVSR